MPNRKFTFHITGMVHLPVNKEYVACAFTMKVYKMCQMLTDRGHEVYLYGAEGSNAPCTEFIQTHTLKELREAWGEGDSRFEIGYDWKKKGFKHDINGKKKFITIKFYDSCIKEINKRKKSGDFFLNMQGYYFKPIMDGINFKINVEPGIGYRGSIESTDTVKNFRAFESSYMRNFTYGSEHPRQSISGNWYDRVIPNYFDLKDFEYSEKKDDYILYIGRLITRKGLRIADTISKELNIPLKLAGQGMKSWDGQTLVTEECTLKGVNLDYVGFVDIEERKKLLSRAKFTVVATTYLEPFAGTHIESMISGTPVLTTDFGVFPGTVINGLNGYRCNTLNDFIENGRKILKGPSMAKNCKIKGDMYSLGVVGDTFNKWFEDIYDWYESTLGTGLKGWSRIKSL